LKIYYRFLIVTNYIYSTVSASVAVAKISNIGLAAIVKAKKYSAISESYITEQNEKFPIRTLRQTSPNEYIEDSFKIFSEEAKYDVLGFHCTGSLMKRTNC
jgi:hypothetical protein